MKLTSAIVVFVVISIVGFHRSDAKCRVVPVIPNFDIDQYLGRWYVQYKYSTAPNVPMSKCWSWMYYKDDSNKQLKMRMNYVNPVTSDIQTLNSNLWLKGRTEPSKLKYKLNYLPYNQAAEYQVLATDYYNYTIEYQCSRAGLFSSKTESLWVLTRFPAPSAEVLNTAFTHLASLGVDGIKLKREDQNCDIGTVDNNRRQGSFSFLRWLGASIFGNPRDSFSTRRKSTAGFMSWFASLIGIGRPSA